MDDAWRLRAACRGQDTRTFYPERSDGHLSTRPAKEVCEGCPVKTECLEECLSLGNLGRWGVWGGLSEKERQKIRRRRKMLGP